MEGLGAGRDHKYQDFNDEMENVQSKIKTKVHRQNRGSAAEKSNQRINTEESD